MPHATISPHPQISKTSETGIKISNSIQWGDSQTWELEFIFDSEGEPLLLTGDLNPWLVLALLPAMQAGIDLEVSGSVSPKLLQNLPTIQNIFKQWDGQWEGEFKKINVTVPYEESPVFRSDRQTACFFSGGVDSFYTVLRHLAEIDLLIYLDNPWADEEGQARMTGKIREAAHQLGKPLVVVKSNFREFLDSYTNWNFSHGAAIASLALLLTPQISRVFLAGTYTYTFLEPNGSHPLLDPLWGTENLEIIHDGLEATRLQKIQAIAGNEVVLNSLRVCWLNVKNELNCGRCKKCLETMVSLRTAGMLDHCTTFAVPLDLDYLKTFHFEYQIYRQWLLENLVELDKTGNDPELAAALRECLANQVLIPELAGVAGTAPQYLDSHRKVTHYEQSLRFQLTEKLHGLLRKNKVVHQTGKVLAHRLWRFLK